jgi:pSer/pThr/pTyr-binding forkhead associated (FHA) protein
MPYLQLRDTQFPLFEGETRVGRGADVDVQLAASAESVPEGTLAVITVAPDLSVTIRRHAAEATIEVNGVALGVEPAPLLHGDRIAFEGVELRFADEARSGMTVELPGLVLPEPAAGAAEERRGSRSGGRLVSMVDGREYAVIPEGLTIGRDAGCDVVVPAAEVSRRHARIAPGDQGYVLEDLSSNGLLVNGARSPKSYVLGRGDTLRIGSEEFRFYADVEAPAASPPSAPPPAPAMPKAPDDVSTTEKRRPQALALLEIMNEGPQKGQQYELVAPLSHVGRGAHNDVPLTDESVSDMHAKIQRRESGWFVVDMGSTNGTYVGGQRVAGEQELSGSIDVRFGGVKMLFRALGSARDEGHGTRVIVGLKVPEPRRVAEPAAAPAAKKAAEPRAKGVPVVTIVLLAILVALTVYLIVQAR